MRKNLTIVYVNYNKKCFSVKTGNSPVEHTRYISLRNCSFVVREGGRQRVLKEQRKNVHAFIKGEKFSFDPSNLIKKRRVSYNPYIYDSFVDVDTREKITKAEVVVCMYPNVYIGELENEKES